MSMINISSYKFIKLTDLPPLQSQLREFCEQQALKGTILLAPEGININLSGLRANIDAFIYFLHHFWAFKAMEFKESVSTTQPFGRMLVKIRKELIPTGRADLPLLEDEDARVCPMELKQWLDEHKDVTLLDTRNAFEYHMGTFNHALHLDLEHFRDFSHALQQLDPQLKKKPVVIFCTGGIRCEKAAPIMTEYGFEEVYQLDGGILKYFEMCGNSHYTGDCFVFDERVAVNTDSCLKKIELE